MIVNDKKFIYTKHDYVYTKKENMKKWFELCMNHISYNITDNIISKKYSDSEVDKLDCFNQITDNIVNDIKNNIDNNKPVIIGLEGYSHSSSAGPLIDLVTFSTLLRIKLFNLYKNLVILAPSSLKLEAAKLAYNPIKKGKKVIKYEWRNDDGISGGKFKKTEMCKSLIDNSDLADDPWVTFLKSNKDEIFLNKNIPKPIEDINDAKILFEYMKKINN